MTLISGFPGGREIACRLDYGDESAAAARISLQSLLLLDTIGLI